MKTQSIFRMLSLSMLLVFLGSVAMAQTKEEKEIKEAKQEQIEHQRGRLKITAELETFIAELKDDSVNWIKYGFDVKEDDDA